VHPSERPCHITWRQEPPTPAQRDAWERLWARLLREPTPEAAGLDPHVSPVIACSTCCLPLTSCTCGEEG
jgi:hypothetical protein